MKPAPSAAAILLLSILGLIAAHKWLGLAIKREIRPVEFVLLCVNLFIAFSLQYYLAKRAGDRRAEKNLLIDELRDAVSHLRLCRDIVAGCQVAKKISAQNMAEILAEFKRVANGLDNFESALEMSDCPKKDCKHLREACEQAMHAYFDYKSAATGGHFPSRPYNRSEIAEQEITYRALHRKLQTIVFDVNRYG
jgi:hypothetical protein